MRVPKIYLETTIFNFPFAADAPQYTADTIRLFEEIKMGRFVPFTSEYVINELKDAQYDLQQRMLNIVDEYKVKVFTTTEEMDRLGSLYVESGIIPVRYMTDAMHIAATVVKELDYIVSLNFRHIVRQKTIAACNAINALQGYRQTGIYSPAEIIDRRS